MGLKQKTVKNVGIVFSMTLFNKGIRFISTLILARLLVPEDFGLVAIAGLAINTIALFREGGLESALIYHKKDVNKAANTAFIIIPIVGVVLFIIAYFSAPFVAIFFENSVVTQIVRISAISLILSSLGSVPSVLFSKELDFKKAMIPQVASSIANASSAVFLALMGFGFWSLVYAGLIGGFAGLIAIWCVTPWRPNFKFDKEIAKELFGYGQHVLGATIVIFLVINLDDALVGKLLGVTALGVYTIAYRISNLPATNITLLINRVMFPTYSRLQDDIKRLKNAYLKTLRYVSLLSFPAAFGIFAISSDFVHVIISEKWIPAIPLIQILCIYGLFRSLNATMGELLKAMGNPKYVRDVAILQLILFAIFVLPVTEIYGLIGMCILVTLTHQVIPFFILLRKVIKILNLKIIEVFATLKTQLFCAVISTIFTLYAREIFISGTYDISTLTFTFIVFSGCYLTLMYLFDKNIINELKELFSMIKKK